MGITAKFLTAFLGCTLATSSTLADIPSNLSTTEDPKRNLARLLQTIALLRASNDAGGNLSDVFANLDAATDRDRIRNSLRTLLPEVARHQALRERDIEGTNGAPV